MYLVQRKAHAAQTAMFAEKILRGRKGLKQIILPFYTQNSTAEFPRRLPEFNDLTSVLLE